MLQQICRYKLNYHQGQLIKNKIILGIQISEPFFFFLQRHVSASDALLVSFRFLSLQKKNIAFFSPQDNESGENERNLILQ